MSKVDPAAVVPLRVNGVKVFSATTRGRLPDLGDRVNRWLQDHPTIGVFECEVQQSSDREYHCLTITVLYWDPSADENRRSAPPPVLPLARFSS